ncbi:MAG: TetR/AcrR family transcriptional regulator [Arcanobacterium sp.]|nr:TetR/AcrR family transcriptional regulator [Arcanobacterium sp.]
MTQNIAATSKNTPRRAATLERLFEAAREVFVERGLNGAAVEDICSRAGFTRGAFYSNYKSKDELFIALLERENNQTIAAFSQLIETYKKQNTPQKIESLADATELVSQFLIPQPYRLGSVVLDLEFQLLAVRTSEHHEKVAQIYNIFLDTLADLATELIAMLGRRFSVPAKVATSTFVSVYQKSVLATLTTEKNDSLDAENKKLIPTITLATSNSEEALNIISKTLHTTIIDEFSQLVLALSEPIN